MYREDEALEYRVHKNADQRALRGPQSEGSRSFLMFRPRRTNDSRSSRGLTEVHIQITNTYTDPLENEDSLETMQPRLAVT